MRICFTVLLAIASITVDSAVVYSEQDSILKTNVIEPRLLKADNKEQTATRKRLRSQEATNFDEDDSADDLSERILPGASKVAKLASKFSGSQKVANKLWLKAGEDPTSVFKMLNLHKAGKLLDETPELLQWLEYIMAYRQKKGADYEFAGFNIYFMLRDNLPDAKVATLLESLKKHPSFESLAKGAQIAQFDRWFRTDKKLPDDVAVLLGVSFHPLGLSASDLRFTILREYTIYFTRYSLGKGNLSWFK